MEGNGAPVVCPLLTLDFFSCLICVGFASASGPSHRLFPLLGQCLCILWASPQTPLCQEASSDTQSRLDSPFGYLLCECSACCHIILPQILWPEIAPFMGLHFHGSESQGLSRPSAQDFTKSDSRCWPERPWGAPVPCLVRVSAEPRALAHRPVVRLQARGSRPNLCHFAISASLFQFSLPLFFTFFFLRCN